MRRITTLASVAVMAVLLAGGCAPASAPTASAPAAAPPAAAPGAAAQPATQAGAPAAKTPSDQEWDGVVAAAKQEGKVVLGIPPGPQYEPAIREAFTKAYPGIEIEMVNLHAAQFTARLARERAAGEYAWDAWIGGPDVDVYRLIKEGALDPLRDDLILPEVADDSKWLGGLDGRFSDEAKQYTFNFGARNGEG